MFRYQIKLFRKPAELMLASKNLLKPADGEPIISPSKDMVLGVYYLTMLQTSRIKVMAAPFRIWTKSIWPFNWAGGNPQQDQVPR